MPKIILNGIEYASGVDQTAFNKIGVEPLDVGTDLSNAVNVLDGRMISLTQQEYNNLPDSKLTNHVAYFITDSPSPAESALWDKVGSEELEIGDNCSDGINQLKQSLTDLQFKAVTGHSVGTAELSLPSSWDELILQVYVQQSILTSIVLNPMVPNSYTNIGLGAYGSSWAIGQIKKDKVKILTVNWGGSDVTANASLYAFYKKY